MRLTGQIYPCRSANVVVVFEVDGICGGRGLVLGCVDKSVEPSFGWLKLRVCNANYASEQPIDANFW